MAFDRTSAAAAAKADLAGRLLIDAASIKEKSVTDRDFPDTSLGASVDGEMAAQMISSGWQIELEADGRVYEYRADKYQLRLRNFRGSNYVIK